MGMGSYGCMATMVLPDKEFVWNIPEHWTLEEAATVPVVYGTVSYDRSCSVYHPDQVLNFLICFQAQPECYMKFVAHVINSLLILGHVSLTLPGQIYFCLILFCLSSSSSALQLFMSFGLLIYFVPLLPLLCSLFPVLHSHLSQIFLTSSSHLNLGLPFGLVAYGFHLYMVLATLSLDILSTFPNQFNPFPVPFKSLVPGQKSRVFSRDI